MRGRLAFVGLLALRGAALFLAAFTLVGAVGELRGRTLDVSLWWVDLRDLPTVVRLLLLLAFAGVLGAWALLPSPGPRLGRTTAMAAGIFAGLAIRDVVRFFSEVGAGDIRVFLVVPLSLFLAVLLACLAFVALRVHRNRTGRKLRDGIALAGAAGCWALLFPLAQMLFFGTTDYRRPADVAVVFGAAVYATGQPSPLLADRVRTGVDLYRNGFVPLLVMSGGDGSGGFNEARVMRDVAVAAGVDSAAILVDPGGNSTEATVANLAGLLRSAGREAGFERVIAVSQAYHLPRVQLAFASAGIDVLTVPAQDPEPIGQMPVLIAREVPAFWAYYLRICLG